MATDSPAARSQMSTFAPGGSDGKVKEPDRVRINGWPEPVNFRQRRMDVTDEVAAASSCPQAKSSSMDGGADEVRGELR